MGYHQAPSVTDLEPLLSSERLATYERHAPAWGCSAIELYLLGLELASSMLWKPALHRAFLHSSGRRTDVHQVVHLLYGARNRIAHHEPIIYGVRRPGAANPHRSVRQLHEEIVTVVRWLSAPLGDWIATHSRTPQLLDHRGHQS